MLSSKNRRMVLVCCLWVGASALFAGCGGSNNSTSVSNDTVTLGVGRSAVVRETGNPDETVQLTLSQVTEDTRCGSEEVCLVAGQFQVALLLAGGRATPQTIPVTWTKAVEVPASENRPGYRIEITDIRPNRRHISDDIPAQDYQITFHIQPLSL